MLLPYRRPLKMPGEGDAPTCHMPARTARSARRVSNVLAVRYARLRPLMIMGHLLAGSLDRFQSYEPCYVTSFSSTVLSFFFFSRKQTSKQLLFFAF